MYLRWLIYLLYICMCAYIHICALAVCLSTLIHLQNALPLLRRRWPRCLWVAFYGFPIFFFAVLHAHKSRFVFNSLDLFSVCRFIYIARLFITISWCLLFPNMRWASETHTNTHAYILSHIHTYIQTTLWKLGGGGNEWETVAIYCITPVTLACSIVFVIICWLGFVCKQITKSSRNYKII